MYVDYIIFCFFCKMLFGEYTLTLTLSQRERGGVPSEGEGTVEAKEAKYNDS